MCAATRSRPDPPGGFCLLAATSDAGSQFLPLPVTGGLSGRQGGWEVRSHHGAWGRGCWHPRPPTPARALRPTPPPRAAHWGRDGSVRPACLRLGRQRLRARPGCSVCGAEAPSCLGEGLVSPRPGRADLRPAWAARRCPCRQQRLGCRAMLSVWRPALLHPNVCGRCGVIDGRHQVGLQLGRGVAGERQGWDLPAQPPGLPEGSVTLDELLLSLGLVSSREFREASRIPTLRVE